MLLKIFLKKIKKITFSEPVDPWGPGRNYVGQIFSLNADTNEWQEVITDMINNYGLTEEESNEILAYAKREFVKTIDEGIKKTVKSKRG